MVKEAATKQEAVNGIGQLLPFASFMRTTD
jgi:hypothetical protein